MIVETVRKYLVDRGLSLEKDIFVHTLPINVEFGILLLYTMDGIRVNHEINDYYQDSFALVVRGRYFDKVKSKMELIIPEITVVNEDFGDIHFNFLKPATLPIYYPKDSSSNYEANVVMDFSCYVKPKL